MFDSVALKMPLALDKMKRLKAIADAMSKRTETKLRRRMNLLPDILSPGLNS